MAKLLFYGLEYGERGNGGVWGCLYLGIMKIIPGGYERTGGIYPKRARIGKTSYSGSHRFELSTKTCEWRSWFSKYVIMSILLQNTAVYRFKMSLFGAVWMADLRIDRPYQPIMGKNTHLAFFEIRIVEIFQDEKGNRWKLMLNTIRTLPNDGARRASILAVIKY